MSPTSGDGAGRRRITLADVAQEAGVSSAAASLALRGEPGVSRQTRERVTDVARRLGYRSAGRGNGRRVRPVTLGMVIKAPHGDIPEVNSFYAPIMAGVEAMCREREADLLFAHMPVDDAYHPLDVPRLVTERACDGLIVIGAHLSRGTAALLEDGPPAVLVDAYAEDAALDAVVSDNAAGARTAVEHLIARGHRSICLVGTRPDSFPSMAQRRRAYETVIAEAGLRPHFVDTPHVPPEAAAAAGMGYLEQHPEVTAVFCANDAVAVALIDAARRAGIGVPDRLSVMGYDDIDLARHVSPPLTTMAVDKLGMGRLAVALLIHRMELPDGHVVQASLRPRLVERRSVREPATRS
ncbi:MAG: LacI family DNA-binding transcriptional regulator [Chloroflexi bacterium]|nr:LacI family DNA-binding transcriptional regulator [Chloroflexota bacterium]